MGWCDFFSMCISCQINSINLRRGIFVSGINQVYGYALPYVVRACNNAGAGASLLLLNQEMPLFLVECASPGQDQGQPLFEITSGYPFESPQEQYISAKFTLELLLLEDSLLHRLSELFWRPLSCALVLLISPRYEPPLFCADVVDGTGRLVDDSKRGSPLFKKVTNKESANIIHRA